MSHPQQPTPYSISLAKSLTIDEMRALHRQALSEAEAKKTELKLVLASRYRELVGSSDEVLEMQRNAKELDELVSSIPELVEMLVACANSNGEESKQDQEEDPAQSIIPVSAVAEEKKNMEDGLEWDRIRLADAPRAVYTCLDAMDVHGSAKVLIDTFRMITKYTRQYPLANAIGKIQNKQEFDPPVRDRKLLMQIKMIYLHLQSMPLRTIQMAKDLLLSLSRHCSETARALSAIHMLNVHTTNTDVQTANKLMDLYFDSKAKVIHELLNRLSLKTSGPRTPTRIKKDKTFYSEEVTDAAEKTISEILMILQYDIILYPYQIFLLRKYELVHGEECIMHYLPNFDHEQLKLKVTNFLAAHLPLIRSKVKTILVGIAGTTASRLGQMRQSLYDKTDGDECIRKLSSSICSWEDAIQMIDVETVTRALEGLTTTTTVVTANSSSDTSPLWRFSLWSTLFSNTFSSLVHSILSTSFHSVHRQVIASLKASLANAPPFRDMLPHEAYRNTLYIATGLDKELKKVSDDAHELLVHAEEREESERRLKQSLYVQTCEIMGRLLNELRRMVEKGQLHEATSSVDDDEEATKQLILGRLCYFLKFRLTSLPTLLNPDSSPAVVATKSGGKIGMITIAELQSAFEIADVDGDGLITFEESMEAMEGAFSGTHFHGAEMLRDTMLLSSASDSSDMKPFGAPRTLTLSELALLSARGLRHSVEGPDSALGTIQRMLNDLLGNCFMKWATIAISRPLQECVAETKKLMDSASTVTNEEWKRLYLSSKSSEEDSYNMTEQEEKSVQDPLTFDASDVGSVSSFLVAFFISISSILNQCVSPSDAMQPCPSPLYAKKMGIVSHSEGTTMANLLRSCIVRESLVSLSKSMHGIYMARKDVGESGTLMIASCGSSSLLQILMDISFVSYCCSKQNDLSFSSGKSDSDTLADLPWKSVTKHKLHVLQDVEKTIKHMLDERLKVSTEEYSKIIGQRHEEVFSACNMFFAPLFGERGSAGKGAYSIFASAGVNNSSSVQLMLNPLPSMRRFLLLPIQAEQSIKELELIQNLEKERSEKAEAERKSVGATAANAVTSSFGFLSSMLNKKK